MIGKYTTYALLFVVIFGTGYWLARLGKPYSVLIQTVHKLIAVGVFVYLVYFSIQLNRETPLVSRQIAALAAAGIFFIAMIATGGMLATENDFPGLVLRIHKIAPYLTAVSTGLSIYLLNS